MAKGCRWITSLQCRKQLPGTALFPSSCSKLHRRSAARHVSLRPFMPHVHRRKEKSHRRGVPRPSACAAQSGLLQIVHGGKPVILSLDHAGVEPDVVRAAFTEPTAQVSLDILLLFLCMCVLAYQRVVCD